MCVCRDELDDCWISAAGVCFLILCRTRSRLMLVGSDYHKFDNFSVSSNFAIFEITWKRCIVGLDCPTCILSLKSYIRISAGFSSCPLCICGEYSDDLGKCPIRS